MEKAHVQKGAAHAKGQAKNQVAKTHASEKPSHFHDVPIRAPFGEFSVANRPTPAQLLQIQQSHGNQAVGRFIQAKLTIGRPDDPYEREADRVADTVMRMPEPTPEDEEAPVQAKPLAEGITPLVQRAPQEEEEPVDEEAMVQSMPESESEEEEETAVATKQLIQRMPEMESEEGEEEVVAAKLDSWTVLQRQVEDEEEKVEVQTKPLAEGITPLQRAPQAEEEPVDEALMAQRMPESESEEEEKTAVAMKPLIQRMPEMESEEGEEEVVAAKLDSGTVLQRQVEDEEEEAVEANPLAQRMPESEVEENGEEVVAAKLESGEDIQRQHKREEQEEPAVQAKSVNSQFTLPVPKPVRLPAHLATSRIQRVCTECEAGMQRQPESQEDSLQAKLLVNRQLGAREPSIQPKGVRGQTSQVSPVTAANIQSLKGGGSPLPRSARSFFEPRFGADFSQVRVHTDVEAAQLNRELRAQAFTHRQDVYFGTGNYSPESGEGKRLLAHELTHVVQQNSANRSLFENPGIQRQEENPEETQQSIFDTSQLSLKELKAEIIKAQNEGFGEEIERLKIELEQRIQPLLLSEDINQLTFEEVSDRIFQIYHWLHLFPEETTIQNILADDHRSFLKSKLQILKVELDKPLSLKYRKSIDSSGSFSLAELTKELELIRVWQSRYDISDPNLTNEAEYYISELNQRIKTEYGEVAKGSFSVKSVQDLPDETIIGYILSARKVLSEFKDANNAFYVQIRENLHLLELEASKRYLTIKPVAGSYLRQEREPFRLEDKPQTWNVPLSPEEMRFKLEQLIAEGGMSNAWNYIIQLPSRERPDDLVRSSQIDPYSPYSPSAVDVFGEITGSEVKPDKVYRAQEMAIAQYKLLEEENKNFSKTFESQALATAYTILNESQQRIKAEMKRYGMSVDRKWGFAGASSLALPANQRMQQAAKQLLASKRNLKSLQLKASRLAMWNDPYIVYPTPDPETAKAAMQEAEEEVKAAEFEHARLRTMLEAEHPALARYESESDLEEVTKEHYGLKQVAWDLDGYLIDIENTRTALRDGDLSVFRLPMVVNITKRHLMVRPGTMRDRVVNDTVEANQPSMFKAIAIAVISIGLGLLAAIPTGGASLGVTAAVVGAGVGGLALDAYLIYDTVREYQIAKAASGTDPDKARALSQEEPSLFWFAVEIVTAGIGGAAAIRTFRGIAKARRAALLSNNPNELAENVSELKRLSADAGLSDDTGRKLGNQVLDDHPDPNISSQARQVVNENETITLYHGTEQKGFEGLGGLSEGRISVTHSAGEHQDFSRGFYMSEDVSVAESSARVRAGQRGSGMQHVMRFDVKRGDLGVIVDVRRGGDHRQLWDTFLDEPHVPGYPQLGTRRQYLSGLGIEQRGEYFEKFLESIRMQNADTIMGPIGSPVTSGAVTSIMGESTQIVIRSQRVADRLNQIMRGR